MADFSRGISIVEIATRKVRPLAHPRGVTLHSVDGLYTDDLSLVAIQNGPGMERVVVFGLDPAGEKVTGVRVLEGRSPELAAPTTGAVAGRDFYYIANSGLDALGEDGKLKPGARPKRPGSCELPYHERLARPLLPLPLLESPPGGSNR